MLLRLTRVVPLVATLALACEGGPDLLELFASSSQYTIVFSDTGSQTYTGSFGGFAAFSTQPGAASAPWIAVYIISDSLRLTQILPFGTQCPAAGSEPITTDSLAVDSVRAIVSLRRTRGLVAVPTSSSFTIDSVTRGGVWGRFGLSLYPVVPEFAGPSATITGQFRLAEIDYLHHAPHCSGGASP